MKVCKIVYGSFFGHSLTAGSSFSSGRRCGVTAESRVSSCQCRRISTGHIVAGGDYQSCFSYGIVPGCITSCNGSICCISRPRHLAR
jgi:hypothetical protein